MGEDIKLPEPPNPDTNCYDEDTQRDVWSHSAEQLEAYARAIEQAATAPLMARIAEIEAELEKTKAIFAASCNHAAVMEMERDAKRWRAMRQTMVAVDFEPEMGGSPVVMFELHAKTVMAGPEGADEIADAAMKEQGHA